MKKKFMDSCKTTLIIMSLIAFLCICQSDMVHATNQTMGIKAVKQTKINKEKFNIKNECIYKNFEAIDNLSDFGEIHYTKKVKIKNQEALLYPEFDNKIMALGSLISKKKTSIGILRKKYQLDTLSDSTYKQYQASLEKELTGEEINDDRLLADYSDIYGFFDIYENTDKNKTIQESIDRVNEIKDLTLDDINEEVNFLQLNLPFHEKTRQHLDDIQKDVIQEVNKDIESSELNKYRLYAYQKNSKFNITKGIKYASRYASTRNKSYRSFSRGDCTNFTSQIKRAGGVPEYIVWKTVGNHSRIDVGKSWYYHGYFSYTPRWSVADNFGKFFGISYKTKSFLKFSSRVKKGSFIGYDEQGDGDWDHMAFVTAKTGKKKKTNGVSYYDFKIAQHSGDYNAYVSSSKCGWDKLHKKKAIVYCIVK